MRQFFLSTPSVQPEADPAAAAGIGPSAICNLQSAICNLKSAIPLPAALLDEWASFIHAAADCAASPCPRRSHAPEGDLR